MGRGTVVWLSASICIALTGQAFGGRQDRSDTRDRNERIPEPRLPPLPRGVPTYDLRSAPHMDRGHPTWIHRVADVSKAGGRCAVLLPAVAGKLRWCVWVHDGRQWRPEATEHDSPAAGDSVVVHTPPRVQVHDTLERGSGVGLVLSIAPIPGEFHGGQWRGLHDLALAFQVVHDEAQPAAPDPQARLRRLELTTDADHHRRSSLHGTSERLVLERALRHLRPEMVGPFGR